MIHADKTFPNGENNGKIFQHLKLREIGRGEIKELEAELDFNLICREVAVLLEPHLPLFAGTPLRGNRRLSTIQQKETRYSPSRLTSQNQRIPEFRSIFIIFQPKLTVRTSTSNFPVLGVKFPNLPNELD